jgi:hypothetical protein
MLKILSKGNFQNICHGALEKLRAGSILPSGGGLFTYKLSINYLFVNIKIWIKVKLSL